MNPKREKLACYECGNLHVESQMILANGEYYCNDCQDELERCEHCHNLFSQDYMISLASGYVCDDCKSAYYFDCYGCNDTILAEEHEYCNRCENDFCEDCFLDSSNHDCSSEREVNLDPLRGNPTGQLKIDRLVGVEIEAEEGDRNLIMRSIHPQCGIVDDGSLSDGSEVQTPPASLSEFEDLIHDTCKKMRKAGFEVSESCGLHVHIDMHDVRYDYSKIAALYKATYAIEEILYSMLTPSRKRSTYALPMRNNWTIDDVNTKMTENQFLEKWYKTNDPNRIEELKESHRVEYAGLNLQSILYRGTVEFRHHTGSLNSEKIINWVDVLLHIVNYSLNNYNDKEIMELNKLSGRDNKKLVSEFYRIFDIPTHLQAFVDKRIAKNNPKFLDKTVKTEVEEQYSNEDQVESVTEDLYNTSQF